LIFYYYRDGEIVDIEEVKSKWIRLRITDAVKEQAMEWTLKHYKNMEEKKRAYIENMNLFMSNTLEWQRYIGYIGKIMSEIFLKTEGFSYTFRPIFFNVKYVDFLINGKTIRAKLSQFKNPIEEMKPGYKFLVPYTQKEQVDYFVSMQCDPNVEFAYVAGFMKREWLQDFDDIKDEHSIYPYPNVHIWKLEDIRKLIKVLKGEMTGESLDLWYLKIEPKQRVSSDATIVRQILKEG
jgi:hypothetical protein